MKNDRIFNFSAGPSMLPDEAVSYTHLTLPTISHV